MAKLFVGSAFIIIVLLAGGLLFIDKLPFFSQPKSLVVTNGSSQPNAAPQTQGGNIDAQTVQAQTGNQLIQIDDAGMHPSVLVVGHGAKVIWSNTSKKTVKIVSDPIGSNPDYPALNLGTIEPGQMKSLVFDKEGSFGYKLNASQTGAVIAL